jgi:hypothetical protein
MSTENLVVWQKWVDPFGFDDEEDLSSLIHNDQTDEPEYDQTPLSPDQEIIQNMKASTIKVMATPMGIIPINDNTASGKIFNFWIGHTNFNITKKIAGVIETISGVETLDIFTRYRFRIAVGKAFNDSEVMRDINNTIYKELNNNV